MKKILIMIAIVFFSAAMIHADVCIKQRTDIPAMMGQQARSEVQQQWFGNGKMATVGGQNGFVIDMTAKKMLMIFNNDKTYLETTLPIEMSKLLPPEAAPMIEQMMKGMTATVEKTGATKKVAGVDTVSYKVTMSMMGMQIPMTMWVAEKMPFDWKKYQEIYTEMMRITMRGSEQMMKEMAKIGGYPLATETEVMGMKTTMETIEIIADTTPPAGVYSVPAGYKKVEHMVMK